MKRALYSIDDEEFMALIERTGQTLSQRAIPYMFVGGVATQTHIVNYLCKKEGTTLQDLSHSPNFRIQDHLRATDDIDITLDARILDEEGSNKVRVSQEIMEALKEIEGEGVYESPSGEHLVSMKLERLGSKRPVFRLGLDREADSPDSEVSLNLYYGPNDTNNRWPSEMVEFEKANYFDFFETATDIQIPFTQDRKVRLLVKGPEQLLATKIARAREKDWTDMLLLYRHANESGNSIDLKEVEQLLSARDPRYHVTNDNLINRFKKFKYLIK